MFNSKIYQHIKNKMLKKWRLYHATDFQSLMYPCFTVCRILGVFPYKFNTSTFEYSKPYYIMSTVVICVNCILGFFVMHGIIISKLNFGNVRNFEIIGYCTICCFIMIITHILSGPRMCLLQTIMEISSRLSSKSYQKLSILIHTKDIIGLIFLIMQMCIYFVKNRMFKFENYMLIVAIVVIVYMTLLQFQMHMLYINCVCILKACFQSINNNLAHMQRLIISDTKLCDPGLFYKIQRNQFSLNRLKTLKKQHLVISNTVQKLNIIFSLQILATIVMSFCTITFEVYCFAIHWNDGIFINFDAHFLVALSTSISYYVIKISLLVWACETGKNKAQEISTTVHDLLNSTNNEQIKNELQLFSLQILHRRNIFSAKGLTVDTKLLAVIIGNITTYLVILVQFLHISHSCDEKAAINHIT
ncbi:putative gustatory receptor 28a [Monomorium pharaonis]|uniref:putative gustatory receptor 28a n=1 Tax=Monomorium pharaonis TaxID=307658 RepID=UPI00102E1B95|nr:putative gustatory receptor 28a [Monomorium pharaonis]